MTTPAQTVGPFLHIGLPWADGPDVVPAGTSGAFRLHGTVFDGAGEPVPDALVETWQADPEGRFAHPADPRGGDCAFRGFGRCPTDPAGHYAVRTLLPGPVDGQAPHIDVSVFARGLLNRVVTRIYFGLSDQDPVLAAVPAERRGTLLAVPDGADHRFDIHLQGPHETVFFLL